jgi:ribonuclease P protein component
VHLLPVLPGGASSPRAGFVIPKAVGGAVVRNRLRRRLRALLLERLGGLPSSSGLVVRALPGAAELDSPALSRVLDAALRTASGADAPRLPAVPAS